jgi:Ser/Thr protein kinase RdoA (MazF antagonist)
MRQRAYTAPVSASGEGRVGELNRRGLAAAVALAPGLGLPAADPVILSGRGNLLVHFAPAPVVARVATLTAWSRRDPLAWLVREVAVAGYVADRGGPVVPPSRAADPGPHVQDGFAISLWEFVPASLRRPSPVELGAALASLHLAAADCPADLGDLTPARDQISDGLDALERESALAPAEADALRARQELLLGRLGDTGPAIVLHGDAHGGNLIATAGGWRWIDLEECCRGPAEWDLATMAGQAGEDAGAALRGYADRAGRPVPGPGDLAPFRDLRMLEALVWTSCMAHLYPARYRDQARQRLATFLG